MNRPREAMSIGAFSTRTQLTARALRHYDDRGLLSPAHIDPATGYRYYRAEQVVVARRIATLRELGLGLDDVAEVLERWGDNEATRDVLVRHRRSLAEHIAARRSALEAVDRLLSAPAHISHEVTTRRILPVPVIAFRYHGAQPPTMDFSAEFVRLTEAVHSAEATITGAIGIANAYDWPDRFDLDLGYTTDVLLSPTTEYTTRVLDGGLFACTTCTGWVNKAAAYETLDSWLDTTGHQLRGPSREYHATFSQLFPHGAATKAEADEAWRSRAAIEVAYPDLTRGSGPSVRCPRLGQAVPDP